MKWCRVSLGNKDHLSELSFCSFIGHRIHRLWSFTELASKVVIKCTWHNWEHFQSRYYWWCHFWLQHHCVSCFTHDEHFEPEVLQHPLPAELHAKLGSSDSSNCNQISGKGKILEWPELARARVVKTFHSFNGVFQLSSLDSPQTARYSVTYLQLIIEFKTGNRRAPASIPRCTRRRLKWWCHLCQQHKPITVPIKTKFRHPNDKKKESQIFRTTHQQ